ncbi:hypothetical protein C8R44DRAFT_752868 [Mycena epipterygia]|nr:hypothetical protein C8R44DRAFT_752868 [Mycena epipterygia]
MLYFLLTSRETPLSALGFAHIFQWHNLTQKWHEEFPALHTEGGRPGSESAGIVAFLCEQLADLDDEYTARDLEAQASNINLHAESDPNGPGDNELETLGAPTSQNRKINPQAKYNLWRASSMSVQTSTYKARSLSTSSSWRLVVWACRSRAATVLAMGVLITRCWIAAAVQMPTERPHEEAKVGGAQVAVEAKVGGAQVAVAGYKVESLREADMIGWVNWHIGGDSRVGGHGCRNPVVLEMPSKGTFIFERQQTRRDADFELLRDLLWTQDS